MAPLHSWAIKPACTDRTNSYNGEANYLNVVQKVMRHTPLIDTRLRFRNHWGVVQVMRV